MTLAEYIALLPEAAIPSFLIGTIIASLLSAFFGFRLFKLSVVTSFFATGFVVGIMLFIVLFGEDSAILGMLFGLLFAILLAMISLKLYKAMIYFVGGAWGALLGFIAPYFILTLLEQEICGVIVGLIAAGIGAFIFAKGFMWLMKFIVIVETAIFGMSLAFEATATYFTTDQNLIFIASLVGLLFGIPAAVYQFKANKGRRLFNKNDD